MANTDTSISIQEAERLLTEATETTHKKYGTFDGVFTPTLLTILGVIMYLRLGWVVGNAGLFGAWLIIIGACVITICTGLCLSSIATNIKLGAGGAFSMISQSLGLEVGGSIGITLYLSQAFAVTMYIFGFRDGWLWIFPDHPAILVDVVSFLLIFLIGSKSAGLAFRVQYIIMAVILASLLSILGSALEGSMIQNPELWGTYPGTKESGFAGTNYWVVFAVFFPAATGVMAGANMSGDLKDPRVSIPKGTMAAIAITTVIYLLLAYWLARSATRDELLNNYTIMIDRSKWGFLVLAGLLGATFSSALSSLVGAPRILQALGEHSITPYSPFLSKRTKKGEPYNAMLVTGVIVVLTLLFRNLNAIAPLITMFFLITYLMVNVVVLIEQSLALPSFRPTTKIPRVVPIIGSIGCLLAMIVINAVMTTVAVVIVLAIYVALSKAKLKSPYGDVRSGLFGAIAEWGAQRVTESHAESDRTWKPSFLIPVEDARTIRGEFHLIKSILLPKGSAKLIGLQQSVRNNPNLKEQLRTLTQKFKDEGIFTTYSTVQIDSFGRGLGSICQSLNAAFFKPNTLFLTVPEDRTLEHEYLVAIKETHEAGMSVLLFADDPKANLGLQQTINVWVPNQDPDWELTMKPAEINAALLLTVIISKAWNAKVNLIACTEGLDHKPKAMDYLENVRTLARVNCNIHVFDEPIESVLGKAPQSDLDIMAMPQNFSFEYAKKIVEVTQSASLFVWDSGHENAFS
ncbi:MAG: Na-K-Cl cotransporter [Bdellovibrionaceae bacterium]|nr:hypothetical protein [Bdellovibrionales bacterium]MCB9086699.1 Na-K-Cl cotransporter [Pseudobdellovibrionaceae bacterium]